MTLLRHRQRAVTSTSPHPDNRKYLVPVRQVDPGLVAGVRFSSYLFDSDGTLLYALRDGNERGIVTVPVASPTDAPTTLIDDINIPQGTNNLIVSSMNVFAALDTIIVGCVDPANFTDYTLWSYQLDGTLRGGGPHYSGLWGTLGRSSIKQITLNGGPALLWGQYNGTPPSTEPLTLRYSLDNGVTWPTLWTLATDASAQVPWGHIHAVHTNAINGRLMICIGDAGDAAGIVQGPPTAAQWAAIDNADQATIAANPDFEIVYGRQEYRAIDVVFSDHRCHTASDATVGLGTGAPASQMGNGIWSFAPDLSDFKRVNYNPRYSINISIAPGYVGAIGCGAVQLPSGGMAIVDFLERNLSKGDRLQVYTSADGNAWTKAGHFNLDYTPGSGQVNPDGTWAQFVHALSSFAVGKQIFIAGKFSSTPGVLLAPRFEIVVLTEQGFANDHSLGSV